jgi:hypothetical protein
MVRTAKPASQNVSGQELANLALLYGGPRRGASDWDLAAFEIDPAPQVLIPGLPNDDEFWYGDFPIPTTDNIREVPRTR